MILAISPFAPLRAQLSPQVTSSTPAVLVAGVTDTIILQGTALGGVSAVTVDGVGTAFAVLSSTKIGFTVTPLPWATGTVQIKVSAGSSSVSGSIPLQPVLVPYDTAARFLQQAGFGPTPAAIADVQRLGLAGWIDYQMQVPSFNYVTPGGGSLQQYFSNTQQPSLALRQRVSLALEQIFVLGNSSVCFPSQCAPLWESLLEKDAFGNIRTLLTDVALSPMMGGFLNNANNFANGSTLPNQNWSREVCQLMTIGTVQLNLDGSQILDPFGKPVPSYSESNIAAMALALSGYEYPANGLFTYASALSPMIMVDSFHDHNAKTILPGITLPAGQTGYQDSLAVQNALIAHPNMAPFLSRRLIQHLVKSNPSPAYITRIAKVFLNDGTGINGNLGAVVKAILLDPEARAGDSVTTQADPTAGHLMEPILYLAMVANALSAVYTDGQINAAAAAMGQEQYFPPSVFSYYSPDHVLSDGTPAPEAQLLDNAHAVVKMGNVYNLLHAPNTLLPGLQVDPTQSIFWNASSPADLLNRINHVLYHGAMSPTISGVLSNFMANDPRSLNNMLGDVLFLAVVNTSYQIIR